MRWLIEGKTNPEIGIILGISSLTAKRHVENVLHKLVVETPRRPGRPRTRRDASADARRLT
jgi:DNA-binding NarL/FixJ family response regulator